ncbi:MAG: DUF4382 domain-containing protein [Nitrososphaerales archaeon]
MKKRALLGALVVLIIVLVIVAGVYLTSLQTGKIVQTSSTSMQIHPSSNATTGTLAVLITDPLSIPQNVTGLYINYSDLQVASTDNPSGWTALGTSGEINLLSVVNSTETIASVNITNGSFNALRFSINSAVITFQGQNYTANLINDSQYLSVPVQGGLKIMGGQISGAIIDMIPTVLLLGNATNPTFAFLPAAKGYVLPSLALSPNPHQGDRNDYSASLKNLIRDLTHFQLDSTVLNTSSLSVTVQNTGSNKIDFQIISLTSTSTIAGGWVPSSSFESVSKVSEFFVILANGSLLPLTANGNKLLIHDLTIAGYSVAPHQSATFTYSGPVTMGALKLLQDHTPAQQLSLGQSCVLTVLGSGKYTQTLVTAGALAISNATSITSTSNFTTTSS